MRKKKFIIIIGIVIFISVGLILLGTMRGPNPESKFEFVEIERGDIENIVSSTGELRPVRTVEVGTQVSGTIDKVFADFNDKVEKGQVLAVLDTTLLAASVKEAEANVIKAKSQYELTLFDFENNLKLYEKDLISEFEMNSFRTSKETTRASLLSAEANLKRAQANLEYAVINSPIDGTVIDRSIEPGQTVAASFSTPTLFIIAEDLSEMEIHVSVDESDIGLIKEGQEVRFTVLAYPEETFSGVVREVRLQPSTIQNVVMYTVIVDSSNEEGLLLPGMTADVEFLIEQRKDVLMVNSSTIRFQPTQKMVEEFQKNRLEQLPDLIKERSQQRMAQMQHLGEGVSGEGFSAEREIPEDMAVLWCINDNEELDIIPVRTGATDGKNTEIEGINTQIIEGMKIISKVAQDKDEGAATDSRNIFMPRPPGRH